MSHKKKCIVCGKELNIPMDLEASQMWRKDYCSEECRRIYNLCVRWHRGVLDPEEAFAELVKCDLERLDNMPDDIREILEDILDLGAPSIEEQPE